MIQNIKFAKVKQSFARPKVTDIPARILREMLKLNLQGKIKPGSRIAITAGSRGISNIALILLSVADQIRTLGGQPFLFSAMGSHGGGTPQGQAEVLASLGITESTVGCPVVCSSDVVRLGVTPSHNVDVYCAREAVEADGVIVVNRVKCHTAFRAPRESGLFKMMGIGMGRVPGAEAIHSIGTEQMGQVILELGRIILDRVKILGGLAIVENGYEETEGIYGLYPEQFEEQEALLLLKSNELLPRLPLHDIDLLIADEMGKNFSGTGMDTNIVGRWRIAGVPEPEKPRIKRLVVLDLSEESHGNANGMGLADFTTKKLLQKIDYRATYLNGLTTGFLQRVMIPVTAENDREAISWALKSLKCAEPHKLRILRVKNTLHLEEILVSENLREEISCLPNFKIVSEPRKFDFDQKGDISGF